MIYLLVIFFSSILLSTGLIFLRKSFFNLTEDTLSLLNTLLNTTEDELLKQKTLIKNLTKQLSSLFLFLLAISLSIGLSALPIMLYANFDITLFKELDFSSVKFYLVLAVGGSIPFFIFSLRKQRGDYSEWSTLLHRIILNNYNISKSIFSLEKHLFVKKIRELKKDFVIVSGLARSGTTALTTLLSGSDKFHSLSYANVPFLMSPNLWKFFYRPGNSGLKERAHGDKIMFGYNTVEALEEHFFKVFLRDSFITENSLLEHKVDSDTYQNYIIYQNLLQPKGHRKSTYLAKNNNLLLRYQSLRELNTDFKVFILFRDPVNHSFSLLKQHQRFSKFQGDDPFILEYMNWMGHHEFGQNLKYFEFPFTKISGNYSPGSINYWLDIWINYYARILEIMDDKNLFLIQYADFLNEPKRLVNALEVITNSKLEIDPIEKFQNTNNYSGPVDFNLRNRSFDIYDQLITNKMDI